MAASRCAIRAAPPYRMSLLCAILERRLRNDSTANLPISAYFSPGSEVRNGPRVSAKAGLYEILTTRSSFRNIPELKRRRRLPGARLLMGAARFGARARFYRGNSIPVGFRGVKESGCRAIDLWTLASDTCRARGTREWGFSCDQDKIRDAFRRFRRLFRDAPGRGPGHRDRQRRRRDAGPFQPVDRGTGAAQRPLRVEERRAAEPGTDGALRDHRRRDLGHGGDVAARGVAHGAQPAGPQADARNSIARAASTAASPRKLLSHILSLDLLEAGVDVFRERTNGWSRTSSRSR